MTLNGVMALILRCFTEFGRFRWTQRKSGWCHRKKFTFAVSFPDEFLVYHSFGDSVSQNLTQHWTVGL